ncbi:MAG: hypothetical protein KY475_12900, partial [Planctomycetes bacterium]|nr:hypothetical protein [Planctomycetota bacterium]
MFKKHARSPYRPSRRARRQTPKSTPRRLRLEQLEHRCLLAITVPGTANPFLADPANVPGNDPFDGTVPPSVAVAPDALLSFSVDGVTGNFPSGSFGPDADGIQTIYERATFGPRGGISDYRLPLNSLVGVFLGDTVGARPPALDSEIRFVTLSPQLGQVFFIGDGLTGTGSGDRQTFLAPDGATRLYLASLDGHEWGNNAGAFTVDVFAGAARPTVSINQAAGQVDPTSASPISFTVAFSEAVTGFTGSDVQFGGTAPGSLTAVVSGSGTTYNVAVSGMTGGGTVTATVAAGAAVNADGNASLASSSSDNSVIYVAPLSGSTVIYDQAFDARFGRPPNSPIAIPGPGTLTFRYLNPDASPGGRMAFLISDGPRNGTNDIAGLDVVNGFAPSAPTYHGNYSTGVRERVFMIPLPRGSTNGLLSLVEYAPSSAGPTGQDRLVIEYSPDPISFAGLPSILRISSGPFDANFASAVFTAPADGFLVVHNTSKGARGGGHGVRLDGAGTGYTTHFGPSTPDFFLLDVPPGPHTLQLAHEDDLFGDNTGIRSANVYFIPSIIATSPDIAIASAQLTDEATVQLSYQTVGSPPQFDVVVYRSA